MEAVASGRAQSSALSPTSSRSKSSVRVAALSQTRSPFLNGCVEFCLLGQQRKAVVGALNDLEVQQLTRSVRLQATREHHTQVVEAEVSLGVDVPNLRATLSQPNERRLDLVQLFVSSSTLEEIFQLAAQPPRHVSKIDAATQDLSPLEASHRGRECQPPVVTRDGLVHDFGIERVVLTVVQMVHGLDQRRSRYPGIFTGSQIGDLRAETASSEAEVIDAVVLLEPVHGFPDLRRPACDGWALIVMPGSTVANSG